MLLISLAVTGYKKGGKCFTRGYGSFSRNRHPSNSKKRARKKYYYRSRVSKYKEEKERSHVEELHMRGGGTDGALG